jgi:hypothetical protein
MKFNTTTINGHEVPVISTIAELKQKSSLQFLEDFDSLDSFMEEVLDSFNPYSEFYTLHKSHDGYYGYLCGEVDGENDLGCWAVDVYKLDKVDPAIFKERYPVLIEYLGDKYIVDITEEF